MEAERKKSPQAYTGLRSQELSAPCSPAVSDAMVCIPVAFLLSRELQTNFIKNTGGQKREKLFPM